MGQNDAKVMETKSGMDTQSRRQTLKTKGGWDTQSRRETLKTKGGWEQSSFPMRIAFSTERKHKGMWTQARRETQIL